MSGSQKRKDFGATGINGNVGHCGPRSIIGGLIDKAHAGLFTDADNARLKLLLNNFELQFPYITNSIPSYDVHATATQKITLLSQHIPENTLVMAMGSALRYTVSQELVTHPEHYLGSFVTTGTITVDQDTHPRYMRKDTTYIDETFIAAAAAIVGPISVNSRDIENRTYNEDAVTTLNDKSNVISLNHEGNHYTANVYDTKPHVTSTAPLHTAKKNSFFDMPSDEEIQQRIDAGMQQDTQRQTAAADKIQNLSTQQLLELYTDLKSDVAARDGDSYLTGRLKEITKERQSDVIASILVNPSTAETMFSDDPDLENSAREELVHALSVEAYRSSQSFDYIDNHVGSSDNATKAAVDANNAEPLATRTPIRASC